MPQPDNIHVLDLVAWLLRKGLGWDDLPEVVGVVVGVSGDLLALAGDSAVVVAQRVPVGVTVEVDLGVLVLHADVVKVFNLDGLLRHDVVAESLLELGAHEIVTRAGTGKDGKVDLEPEKVEQEGDDDQTGDASAQMLAEFGKTERALSPVDVEEVPKVNSNRDTDGEESECSDVFGRDDTAEADTRHEKPLPPLAAEGSVTQLVESDVAPHGQSHEEDKRGVEQDQSGLANVCIVEKNKSCCENAGREGVTRLPHDAEGCCNSESAHHGGHGAVCHVWHPVCDVRVSNVVKQELAIVSDQPAGECEEELAKRRVNVEKVSPLEVVRGEL